MTFRRFEEIEAWRKAREITKLVYSLTGTGEFSHDFTLRDQTRRAAISVMANIAEGFIRHRDKEFAQFLLYAKSSGAELQSHLYIALDAGYVDVAQFSLVYGDIDACCRQISRLISHLNGK